MARMMEDMEGLDLYKILGVGRNASDAELEKSYGRLRIQFDPDKNPEAIEKFKEISFAYEVLSNPEKRDFYDRHGIQGLKEGGGPGGFPGDNFVGMVGGWGGGRRRQPRGEDTPNHLRVSLEDLYDNENNGKTPNLQLSKTTIVKKCYGMEISNLKTILSLNEFVEQSQNRLDACKRNFLSTCVSRLRSELEDNKFQLDESILASVLEDKGTQLLPNGKGSDYINKIVEKRRNIYLSLVEEAFLLVKAPVPPEKQDTPNGFPLSEDENMRELQFQDFRMIYPALADGKNKTSKIVTVYTWEDLVKESTQFIMQSKNVIRCVIIFNGHGSINGLTFGNDDDVKLDDFCKHISTTFKRVESDECPIEVVIIFAQCYGHCSDDIFNMPDSNIEVLSFTNACQVLSYYTFVDDPNNKKIIASKHNGLRKYAENERRKCLSIQDANCFAMDDRDGDGFISTDVYAKNHPVSIVGEMVHLLDQSDADYTEEIELHKLRHQVTTEIHSQQRLENDLDTMDIILAKKRITLQAVISQKNKLKDRHESSSGTLNASSKEILERLEAYHDLFYLLQTKPVYLARLTFELPQSRFNESESRFNESVILALYNYAISNPREEYLLLQLFKTALEEEIRFKVEKMSDIMTWNPLVIKMIISFNRNAKGQFALRDLLDQPVQHVLDDLSLTNVNTSPIEVYNAWINQIESQGYPSGLPREVSVEWALGQPEVLELLQQSIASLKQATSKFLQSILKSLHHIPYGLRYMAKVLRDAVQRKFPDAIENYILKLVGNLIYHRYINFEITNLCNTKGMTNDQRRNLRSITKILHCAASNKGFGREFADLSCLNTYIMEAHEKFMIFFRDACEVEEPDVHFNIDQYTDSTRVTKPVIYISEQEICGIHQLLIEHQDAIAPECTDVVHQLLDELGDVHTPAQECSEIISLKLENRFEVPGGKKSLLIRTKRMIMDVIRCQSGENLTQILDTPATDKQENEHQLLSIKGRTTRLPLDSMKVRIRKNLEELVKMKLAFSQNHYQDLINDIVQDIKTQISHRQQRKQEMQMLRRTLESLATKRSLYQEQIDDYNQYVQTRFLDDLSDKINSQIYQQ